MGEHGRSMRPLQSVLLQGERTQHRRGRAQWVEGAEEVGGEAGAQRLAGADRTSGGVLGFQNQHAPARVSEQVGGDQAVVPGADDDGVVARRPGLAVSCGIVGHTTRMPGSALSTRSSVSLGFPPTPRSLENLVEENVVLMRR
jgi:hypothetical protein